MKSTTIKAKVLESDNRPTITITIEKETWQELSKIKIDRAFKNFTETINYLLDLFGDIVN